MKRYIKSSTESLTPAMQKLIQDVAGDFKKSMQEMDCETWKEFVQTNDWEASDIRAEIDYMVNRMYDGVMLDDGSYIEASDGSGISYREFKKQVIASL